MKENFSKGHKYRTKEGEVIVILKIDNDFKRIRYKYLNDGSSSENPDTYPFWSFSEWNSGSYEDLSGTVIVGVNNLAMGETTGEGIYDLGTEITIEAKAYEGNQFYKWDDGNLDNPRTIKVTDNLKFVAIFKGKSEGKPEFSEVEIVVKSDDENKGTTRGSGKYTKGAEVELIAIAKEGFVFTHWDDGNKENPCCIIVSRDAEYTAFFEALSTPNENYTKQHEQFEKEKNSLNQQLETAHNTIEEIETQHDKCKLFLTILLIVFGVATIGLFLFVLHQKHDSNDLRNKLEEKAIEYAGFDERYEELILVESIQSNQIQSLNDSIKILNDSIINIIPLTIHEIGIKNLNKSGTNKTVRETLYADDTMLLRPKIKMRYTGYKSGEVDLRIKIYRRLDEGMCRIKNYKKKVLLEKGEDKNVDITGWGEGNTEVNKAGLFQFEIWYESTLLKTLRVDVVDRSNTNNENGR